MNLKNEQINNLFLQLKHLIDTARYPTSHDQ